MPDRKDEGMPKWNLVKSESKKKKNEKREEKKTRQKQRSFCLSEALKRLKKQFEMKIEGQGGPFACFWIRWSEKRIGVKLKEENPIIEWKKAKRGAAIVELLTNH